MGQHNDIAEKLAQLLDCVLRQSSVPIASPDSASRDASAQAQLLYERWMCKPEWALRAEGIPLLIGIAPDAWETLRASGACGTLENELWASVRDAVITEGKPRVINPDSGEEDWRCAPIDLYQWARASGVPIPEPFEALMQFIQRVVPGSSASSPDALPGNLIRLRETMLPARGKKCSARRLMCSRNVRTSVTTNMVW